MKFSKIVFILSILVVQTASAQDTPVVSAHIFNQFSDRISLSVRNHWLFRPGNDSNWAQPNVDTIGWEKINLAGIKKYADKDGRLEGWFRMKIKFDTSLSHKKMWIDFEPWNAMEFYIDGRLMAVRGNTGDNGKPFSAYNSDQDPLSVMFNNDSVHTFAIHFAGYLSPFPPHGLKIRSNYLNLLTIIGPNPYTNTEKFNTVRNSFRAAWFVICAILSLLFWLLVFLNRREKDLVWIALCTSVYALLNFGILKTSTAGTSYRSYFIYQEIVNLCYVSISTILVPLILVKIFKRNLGRKLFIILLILFFIGFFTDFISLPLTLLLILRSASTLFALGVSLYYIFSSWKKLKGAQWAVVVGLFLSLMTLFTTLIIETLHLNLSPYFALSIASVFYLAFPLSLLAYVSIRFKEIIQEVRINAGKVIQLSEEKRIQAENQQKVLQEEVNRQTAEIRNTLDNLRATQSQLIQSEKMASLGELTAGIAHEIQNPLNFVNNFSEVNKEMISEMKEEIAKGNYDEVKIIADDIGANEDKINHHGKRADAIVKSMLEHSRTSTGVKEPTDINKLADEYLRLAYHGLRAKDKSFNAEMKTDFDESLSADEAGIGKINIIPQDIGRVLLNLYNNAFYACAERSRSAVNEPGLPAGRQKSKNLNSYEPTVWVTTKKEGSSVIITVKDNGGGIPENIKEKIFQPFFTTKPAGSGTGLGLSLSYDIVKAHGGEIKVESLPAGEVGKEVEGLPDGEAGTEFIIKLPVSK